MTQELQMANYAQETYWYNTLCTRKSLSLLKMDKSFTKIDIKSMREIRRNLITFLTWNVVKVITFTTKCIALMLFLFKTTKMDTNFTRFYLMTCILWPHLCDKFIRFL